MTTPTLLRPLRRSRRRAPRRGAALIEFALVLPVIVLVFGAIIELSLFISTYHRVTRVARDAARVGSVVIEGDQGEGDIIEAAALEHAETALAGAGLDCEGGCEVETEWALDGDSGYFFITVDVHYPYTGITNVMPALAERGINARFAMVSQQQ
mgnify:CR=1 FL=1|jgi:Flp pilus assembly protein TadG